jgi:DeoR/GlpR family transcriptional regulator of sugar metabolism
MVADSSKVGQVYFVHLAPLEKVDLLAAEPARNAEPL